MEKIAIFIDAGYLNKVLEQDFDRTKIDFEKMKNILSENDNLLRAYYYNCLPYQSSTPTDDEKKRFSSCQKFHGKLKRIDCFDVREGRLEYRGTDDTGKRIFVQKRVDIMLACDLVQLSIKNKIEKAIIITGDSDFLPAIDIAKKEGVSITLLHGSTCKPHNDLYDIADHRKIIDQTFIDQILLN